MKRSALAASPMLSAALIYAEHGIPVFPVWGIWNGRCGCGKPACQSPGKHPVGHLAPHGLKNASIDPAVVARWWQDYEAANIGTPTNWAVVLDVDVRMGGQDSLR